MANDRSSLPYLPPQAEDQVRSESQETNEHGHHRPKSAQPGSQRSRVPHSNLSLVTRLCPRPSTLAVALLTYYLTRQNFRQPSSLITKITRWLAIWISIINWRAVPLYWHVMTLFPIAKVRFRRWRLGSNYELFVKRQGVIGQSPFQARTISKHCATWNSCDFMLHLSNSAYAIALDEARCEWHVKMLALTMRNDMEQVRPLIASTHFAYFIEIPMLADYQVEIRPVSWDHKWVYLMAKFTTDPPKGSSTRVVNCISITRTVNKIGRRTVPPAKLFAACGFGSDDSNWKHICHLRQQPKSHGSKLSPSQEWLLNGEDFDGLSSFEAVREANLEVIRAGLDGCISRGVNRLQGL